MQTFRKGARVMVPNPAAANGSRVPGTVTKQGHSGMTYVLLDESPREIPYYRDRIETLPEALDPRRVLARVKGE